ncbi:MAG TPA: hypothetical protein VHY82_09915 [Acetobacteraceae bacterium]|nr:hypothetical protein [Acetobacteraceae bacterium]
MGLQASVSTVAPPIVAVFRPPAAAAGLVARVLLLAEDAPVEAPEEPHATRAARPQRQPAAPPAPGDGPGRG